MKKHIVFGLITLSLAISVIYFLFLGSGKKTGSFNVGPTVIEVATVTKQNIPLTVKATGQLIAPNTVTLKAQIAGVVEKIYFTSGQYVKAGELLMTLDDTQQMADVNSTLADYTKAEAQYNRTSTLFKDNNAVSQSELDSAKADYMQTKAKYDAALYRLSNTKIVAPFTGFLTLTTLAKGSYVSAGDTLVTLVDKENLELQYALPESYAKSIALGQVVAFRVDAFPGQIFHAKADYISPNVSDDNLTFTMRAAFDNSNNVLTPGMSVYVSQVLKADNLVLAVPESALSAQSGGFIVYVVEDGKAKALPVEIGQINKGYVGVLSGLKQGQQVIVSAEGSISDGIAVKVE
ncbi:efflux RND transporter periplasmic adaptor subunit [Fastidiosibacter lacustris]|uniref:efflux RND transporter periplasmic adaptor subunit n=1 Tax=Fastidiosibacter lacustris TaxID=2056695 RepID=UPI00130089A7|nr:efflux RND transporter periplasmic adaptor subunit [Fastidiosibacter lacustris]